jgi:hypothetical protein
LGFIESASAFHLALLDHQRMKGAPSFKVEQCPPRQQCQPLFQRPRQPGAEIVFESHHFHPISEYFRPNDVAYTRRGCDVCGVLLGVPASILLRADEVIK